MKRPKVLSVFSISIAVSSTSEVGQNCRASGESNRDPKFDLVLRWNVEDGGTLAGNQIS